MLIHSYVVLRGVRLTFRNILIILVVLGALTSVSTNKYSPGIFIFFSFIACFYTTCLIFCCFDWWVLSFTKYFISLFLTSELERNTTLENFNIFFPFFVSYFTLPFPFLSIFLFFYLCIVGSGGASQLGGSLLGIPLGYKAN